MTVRSNLICWCRLPRYVNRNLQAARPLTSVKSFGTKLSEGPRPIRAVPQKNEMKQQLSNDLTQSGSVENPLEVLSKLRTNKNFYIMDKNISRLIPQKIGDETLQSESTAVGVMYPGPGPLFAELVNRETSNLYLFEPQNSFRRALSNSYGEKANIVISNDRFFRPEKTSLEPHGELWKLLTLSQYSHVKIISPITTPKHLKQIVLDFTTGNYYSNWQNIEFYLITNKFTTPVVDNPKPGTRRLRTHGIWLLWKFFVNTEKILLPFSDEQSPVELSLFRCTYKSWPSDVLVPSFRITRKERQMLASFVLFCFGEPSSYVINTLEKLSPKIGLQILRQLNYLNLHTKFHQLTLKELLLIYEVFRRINLKNNRVWQMFDEDWVDEASI